LKTSQDLILTTHVGSLPRSDAVVELLERRESGGELDEAAQTIIQRAVADIVSRQVEIGIDVVSDGETAKMSYATYVKDRLTGFSEEGPTKAARPHLDVAPFPDFQRKMELLTGARRFKRVSCVGPVAVRDRRALQRDLVNMKLPADKVLLPGVIDTSTNYVEHPDLVAQRIVRFAELVGRARVIASTDCGFGTSAGYGKIDPEIAFLKLGALVAGAARASKHLW
jgi:methionine synthase II (cobalamin-independent)